MLTYISAGELAGEGVAGLVEEDGDELEGREQERPPQLQNPPHNEPDSETHPELELSHQISRSKHNTTQPNQTKQRTELGRGCAHEEDDDGGDADGGYEDLLVAVAASLQLPVHLHHPPRRRSAASSREMGGEEERRRQENTRKSKPFELVEEIGGGRNVRAQKSSAFYGHVH